MPIASAKTSGGTVATASGGRFFMWDRLANLLLSRLLSYYSRPILAWKVELLCIRNVLCIGLFQKLYCSPPTPYSEDVR